MHWLQLTLEESGTPIQVRWGKTSEKKWVQENEFVYHPWDSEDRKLFRIRRDRTRWMQIGRTEDDCGDAIYTLRTNGYTNRAYGKHGLGTYAGKAGLEDFFAMKREALAKGEPLPAHPLMGLDSPWNDTEEDGSA